MADTVVEGLSGAHPSDGEPVEDAGRDQPGAGAGAPDSAPVVIKKYANRRLYNTKTSSYVTLEHLSEMVRENVDFIVQDAKTGEEITRSVLAQIIFDQESRGQNLLPVPFLRRLIRFYGDSMQGFLPAYLEMSMDTFSRSQEQLREQFNRAFGTRTPMAAFEEQTRQNMAMFQQALKLWSPFAGPGGAGALGPSARPAEPQSDETISELKKQMEAMQKQLDQLSGGRKP